MLENQRFWSLGSWVSRWRAGAYGLFVLTLACSSGLAQPANDNFANARLLEGESGVTYGDTLGATAELGEPNHLGPATASVWFRWVAPRGGFIELRTQGSNFDTLLAAYSGTDLADLFQWGNNDNDDTNTYSTLLLPVDGGTEYFFALDSPTGDQGFYQLAWKMYPPPNDNFADAIVLEGRYGTTSGENVQATPEAGEPEPLVNVPPQASVWFSWTAPRDGSVTFNTFGSSFDTLLASYEGDEISSLTQLAANDNAFFGQGTDSSITFGVIAGTTYHIVVDSPVGAFGVYNLSWNFRANITDPNAQFSFLSLANVNAVTEDEGILFQEFRQANGPRESNGDNPRDVRGALVTVSRSGSPIGKVLVDYFLSTTLVEEVTRTNWLTTNMMGMVMTNTLNLTNMVPSAEPGRDFDQVSGTLQFDNLQTRADFVVPINHSGSGGRTNRPVFCIVNLSNARAADDEDPDLIAPSGGGSARLDIRQIWDYRDRFSIQRSFYRVDEDDGDLEVTVILPGGGGNGASVILETLDVRDEGGLLYDFSLQPGSDYADHRDRTLNDANYTDGTPRQTNRADFVSFSQRLTFATDEIVKTIRIPFSLDDGDIEFNEDVRLILRDPQGDRGIFNGISTVTILNDDQPAGALDREWNPDNVVWTPFPLNQTPGANGEVYALQVLADQKTLIAGDFTAYNSVPRSRIARINPDGSHDNTFNPGTGPDGFISSFVMVPEDSLSTNASKIIVGGAFSSFNNVQRNSIARLNDDGSLDLSFNPGAGFDGAVRSLLLLDNDKILAVGDFQSYNGIPRGGVARLNNDGSLDLAFDPREGANGIVWAAGVDRSNAALQIDAGQSGSGPAEFRTNINTGASSGVLTVVFGPACVPDRLTVYYGPIQIFDSGLTNEFLGDPSCDFTNFFGPITYVIPYGPGAYTDLTLIVNEGSGDPGTVWDFSATIENQIVGEKVYIGGEFSSVDGQPRNGIARLNSDGTLDTDFDPGDGVDGAVFSIALQSDFKPLIGGQFTTYDFRPRESIARLNVDGSIDTTFNPGDGFDNAVYHVSFQPDGKIMAGGRFTAYDGVRRRGFARLFVDGSLDTSFLDTAYNQYAGLVTSTSTEPAPAVNAIAMQTNGDFLIGGSFHLVGGNPSYEVVDTNLWIVVIRDRARADFPVWTRQDKRTRFNVARVLGGKTYGPGNATLVYDEYFADENGGTYAVDVERVNGRLGGLSAQIQTIDRVAQSGVDYSGFNTGVFWEQGWLVDVPESVGRASTRYGFVSIFDDGLVEGDEPLEIYLSSPSSSIYLGGEEIVTGGARGRFQAPLTITDNDFNHGILKFTQPTYSVDENGLQVVLTVLRTNGSVGAVTVDYRTVNGTATAGLDYSSRQGTLNFASGQTARTITIPILDDSSVEPDETFTLVLTNATGGGKFTGGLATSSEIATVNIIDNDYAPGHINFAMADYSVSESAGMAYLTLTRTGGSVGQVSVRVRTMADTAVTGQDFAPIDQTNTWAHGDTSTRVVAVPIINEVPALVEGDERLQVVLSQPSLPGLIGQIGTANLTIVDDDSYGTFEFSQPLYDGDENGGSALITVLRLGGSAGSVQLNYSVLAGDGGNTNNVPAEPEEFVAVAQGVLQFGPGETAKSFPVTLLDDELQDGDKTVELRITNVDFGDIGPESFALLRIVDNESFNGPAGSVDPTFNALAGPNGDILDLALQPDGKIVMAGSFTRLNGVTKSRVGRLLPNGALDGPFNIGQGPNGTVSALALQSDGKMVIGGYFTSVQGTNRNYLARINPDGGVDTFFNPGTGPDNPVLAVALTEEGRVIIGGSFASINSQPRPFLAMVNTNGAYYPAFNPGLGPDGEVLAIAVQRDGKILIGGNFTTVDGFTRPRIARLHPDGSLDRSFDPGLGADAAVRVITVDSAGQILVGGSFTTFYGIPHGYLARLHDDGSVDTSIPAANGGGADASVFDITLQLDGKIIVTGDFTKFNGVTRNRITRLNSDGTTDPTINFGAGANAFIARSVIQPNRMIVIGGGFSEYNQQPRQRIARLHGGSLDGSGALDFTTPFFSAVENAGEGEIFVRRTGGTDGEVSIEYQTIPGSATEGLDYFSTNGVLHFPEGEVLSSFKIRIQDDEEVELDESILAFLTVPADGGGGVVLGPQPVATLSIVNDDILLEFEAASYSVNEGISGGNAAIRVRRSGSLLGSASVDYVSFGGTATPGVDYEPVIGSLTFGPGEAFKTILIPIHEDALIEGNETVQLELSNPTGRASLGRSAAILQIIDNDFAPGQVSFSAIDFTVNEYETNAVISVIRTNGSTGVITVNYTTANLTALAGEDYLPSSGSLTFADGELRKTFNVAIIPDFIAETNELVQLQLFNVTGGGSLGAIPVASLTIINNDLVHGSLNFSKAEYRTSESNLTALITVTRSFGSLGNVSVTYSTTNGTAEAGSDYVPATGQLSWSNGDITPKTFMVELINDNVVEGQETVGLTLSNPTGLSTLGTLPQATLIIDDDDSGPGQLGFASATFSAVENTTNAVIRVYRSLGQAGQVSINYQSVLGGTALPGIHYTNVSGQLVFQNGETNKSFLVPLVNNTVAEGDRTVRLTLTNPSNGAGVTGQVTNAVLNIIEDEPQAGSIDQGLTGTGANAPVRVIQIQTNDNKLLVGGEFTEFNGLARGYVARLNLNGTVDALFDPANVLNGPVRALASVSGNRVVVGGAFTNVDNRGIDYLVRLDSLGAVDDSFLSGLSGPNSQVLDMAVQPDGKLLVGGLFTSVNGQTHNHLVRLNTDGSVDATFNLNGGTDGAVRVIRVQANGRILIGGDFSIAGGISRPFLARLNANGSIDSTFNMVQDPNDSVQALAIQENGAILIGGLFTQYGATPRAHIARLNQDGSLDLTFNPGMGADETLRSIVLQQDGKIILGGAFTIYDGTGRSGVARLNQDGSLDRTFNVGTGANAPVSSLVLQSDRKIVVGGAFTEFNGLPKNYLTRLHGGTNQGSGIIVFAASDFPNLENKTNALVTVKRLYGTSNQVSVAFSTSDGTAIANTHYYPTNGLLTFAPGQTVARFTVQLIDDNQINSNRTINLVLSGATGGASLGLPDQATITILNNEDGLGFSTPNFLVNEAAGAAEVIVDRTGLLQGVVTVGYATTGGTATRNVDYQGVSGTLTFTNGQASQSFFVPILDDTLVEPNESIFLSLSNVTGGAVLVLSNANISILDDDFSPGALRFATDKFRVGESAGSVDVTVLRTNGTTGSLLVQYVVGGGNASAGADYLTESSGVLSFADGQTSQSLTIPILPDNIVEGDEFFLVTVTNVQGGAMFIGSLVASVTIEDDEFGPGSLDRKFNPGAGANNFVRSLAVQRDGKIVLGGAFTQFDGVNRNFITRLSANGSQDPDFFPGQGPNALVASVAVQSDGKILLGGAFTLVDNAPINRVARLGALGTVDQNYLQAAGFNGSVNGVAVQANDRAVVGGAFNLPNRGVIQLRINGSIDTSFNPGLGANAPVHYSLPLADGRVLLVGAFTTVGGAPRNRVARLNSDGAVDSGFLPPAISSGTVFFATEQTDGRVVIVGDFHLEGQSGRVGIARLNQDGSLDTGFDTGTGANDTVYAVDIQSDGFVVIGGSFTRINGEVRNRFARLRPNGSVDPGFDPGIGANNTVYSLSVLPNDDILIAGNFSEVSGVPRHGVAKIIGSDFVLRLEGIRIESGVAIITISSKAGRTYALDASEDLNQWQEILTRVAVSSTLELMDNDAGGFEYRFYRVREVGLP